MAAAMVFDEELGLAYEGYNAELIRAFLILAHYTDLDLTELDNPEGRYTAYDAIATHGLWDDILDYILVDMDDVHTICMRLANSAKQTYEHRHSLEYRMGKTFGSLLSTENLLETVAKAEGLNSKLIDMLGAVRKEQKHSEVGGIRFAKKEKENDCQKEND